MKFCWILTLLLQARFTSGQFLQNLEETLGLSLSYLKKGVDLIRNVDEFIENTIGEDCTYECPSPQKAIPKSGHYPKSNGCGSMDFLFDESEESFIHVEEEFTICCNGHDLCYDTCGNDKDECDLKFKKCLYGTCKEKRYEFLDSKKCRLKAKLFFITVLGVGCQPYISAQKSACQCVKDEL